MFTMRNVLTFFFVLALAGCTSLDLEPREFIAANVGKPYRQKVKVTNTDTPLADVRVSDGELPPGLKLLFDKKQHDHFFIEGTPVQAGHYPFTISMGCFGTNFPGRVGSRKVAIEVYSEK